MLMKKTILSATLSLLCMLVPWAFVTAHAQGSAFTYQGRLSDGVNPANGIYQLQFALLDAASAGTVIAGPLTNSVVAVSNGLFTVSLDFGLAAFSGDNRWLELGVRTNGSAAAFTLLAPRQPISATPYALRAAVAGSVSNLNGGTIAPGSITGLQLAGNAVTAANISAGQVVRNLNGLTDAISLLAGTNLVLQTNGQTLTIHALGAGFAGLNNFSGTNLTLYDALGRLLTYLASPYTTNYITITNRYTFSGVWPGAAAFNDTYTYWPAGSTNTYLIYTNPGATKMMMTAPVTDPFNYAISINLFPSAGNFPITPNTTPAYDNYSGTANPLLDQWEDANTGLPVHPIVTAGSATTTNSAVVTNLALTALSNVRLDGSVQFGPNVSTNNGALGTQAFLTNSVPAEIDISGAINNPTPGAVHMAVQNNPVVIFSWQPYPGSVNRYTNVTQVISNLANLNAKGYLAPLTNSGAPVVVNADVGSLVRNTNYVLMGRPGIYPQGVPQYIAAIRSFNCEVGYMRNIPGDLVPPQPTNVPGFYFIPNANTAQPLSFQPLATYDPTGWSEFNCDLMTVDMIARDIQTFYAWGVSQFESNDGAYNPIYSFQTFERTAAYNILHPFSDASLTSRTAWNSYSGTAHPLRYTAFESLGGTADGSAFDCDDFHNAIQTDAPATAPRWGTGTNSALLEFRRFSYNHPLITKCNRGGGFEGGIGNLYPSHAAIFALCEWSPLVLLHPGYQEKVLDLVTNAGWLRIHNDLAHNFPSVILNQYGGGVILAKPLATGAHAVGFFNESGATTPLTVNWPSLGLPLGQACNIYDLWTSNYVASATGSFTTNLAPGSASHAWLEFRPVFQTGITTNLQVTTPAGTRTLQFSFGVLTNVSSP